MKTIKTCACIGCNRQIHEPHFLCRDHWFQVPKNIRDEVWNAYRGGSREARMGAVKKAYKYLRENAR